MKRQLLGLLLVLGLVAGFASAGVIGTNAATGLTVYMTEYAGADVLPAYTGSPAPANYKVVYVYATLPSGASQNWTWGGFGMEFTTPTSFFQVVPWKNYGTTMSPSWRKVGYQGADYTTGVTVYADNNALMGDGKGPTGNKNTIGFEWDSQIPVAGADMIVGNAFENGPLSPNGGTVSNQISCGFAFPIDSYVPSVDPDLGQPLAYLVVPTSTAMSAIQYNIDVQLVRPNTPGSPAGGYTKAELLNYNNVPEPATLALVSLGGLALLRRRRA